MTRPRTRTFVLVLALLLVAAAAAVYLRRNEPPEVARLLPESDAIVYMNLRPLRAATHFERHPVKHDPDYQHFIDGTGIDFERDLDEAAFALSRQTDLLGPNGPVGYSEVFSGSFDRQRLTAWLARSAATTETYSGYTLYSIQNAGRAVRVAVLSRELVAVSNTPAPEQIHSIIDHYRSGLLSFSGPTLLAEHYKDLPLLSLAWGIGQIGLPLAEPVAAPGSKPVWQQSPMQLLGFTLPFRLDATFVASLRWTGALRLRVEEIAPSESAAMASAEGLAALVNVAKMAENNLPAGLTDENSRALVNSVEIVHYNDRAVVNATVPIGLLRKMVSPQDSSGGR